jgi:rhodanese-related sulfurtransferase
METMNRSRTRLSITVVLSIIVALTLSACAPAKLDVAGVTAIIDTRSPAEFAKSHIVGAINMEYVPGAFVAAAVSLDRKGTFYVYGETADQATLATTDISSLGIQNATNLGSFTDAQNVLTVGVTK